MARHLGALPGRKPCIEVAKLPLGLGLQPFDLGGNVDAAVVCGIAKVRNSRLQLRNGLFELKNRGHWRLALLAGGLAVHEDRKRDVVGKGVSLQEDLGGSRIIKKPTKHRKKRN